MIIESLSLKNMCLNIKGGEAIIVISKNPETPL
jgi:hypothetical protein